LLLLNITAGIFRLTGSILIFVYVAIRMKELKRNLSEKINTPNENVTTTLLSSSKQQKIQHIDDFSIKHEQFAKKINSILEKKNKNNVK